MSVSRPMANAPTARLPVETKPARLDVLIRAEQLAAVRRSVLTIIPANVVLSLTCALVSVRYGHAKEGLIWLAMSSAVNLARVCLYKSHLPGVPQAEPEGVIGADRIYVPIERQLRLSWLLALVSGLVWAAIPALCDGYTSPQTLFFLIVVCGITAGAVTHGTACARVPIAFIVPVLASAAGCLLVAGGFDRNCLSATVLLYLTALVRSALHSEAAFRESSRLKNEATALARSLSEAHARAAQVADEMTHRAAHDPLTGLLNRAGFLLEVERRTGGARAPRCLMLLDLDGFKSINDVYGHEAGDRVLAEVARRLRRALPGDFAIARPGGDEFAVLYDPRAAAEPPEALAGRLIAAIRAPFATFDAGRLGVSIGIHQAEGSGLADMLACADEALYAAKSTGRNRHCIFDDRLRGRLDMRRDVERDLGRALVEGALTVWYQPIFGEGGRVLNSLEALLRWQHPRHDWIPPTDLVAAASIANLSEPLLRFILADVCAMLRTLRTLGLGHVLVAMNVSPREMSQLPVDTIVLGRLRALGLEPSTLEIEITEETALDICAVQDKLAALSRAGTRVALDDFGVGYSSLASLRHIGVDRVNIDRSFVTGLSGSTGDQILVQAVLTLGRSLGFDVVAEGVETAEDLCTLQAAGCRFMQGYHLARPMPAAAVADWLRGLHIAAA